MTAFARPVLARLLSLVLALAPVALRAQEPIYAQQQLDQLLAPIALYPDPLLSQIFVASIAPLELSAAAQWSIDHPGLQGEDALAAVAEQDWDESVKSLVAFPQVLAWMAQNPQWMRALGDAFSRQPAQVMDTVQALRQRALAAGNLLSDERMRVVVDGGAISIEPADPQLVYVPYYDPGFVYGDWWWPSYPPVSWRPAPGYVFLRNRAARLFWSPAVAVAPQFFFTDCDWRRHALRELRPRRASAPAGQVPRVVRPLPGVWVRNLEQSREVPLRRPAPSALGPLPRHEAPLREALRHEEPRGVEPSHIAPLRAQAPLPAVGPAVMRMPLAAAPPGVAVANARAQPLAARSIPAQHAHELRSTTAASSPASAPTQPATGARAATARR